MVKRCLVTYLVCSDKLEIANDKRLGDNDMYPLYGFMSALQLPVS